MWFAIQLALAVCVGADIILAGAPARAQSTGYVVNFRSDTLSIFRTDSDAVSATVSLASERARAAIQQIPGPNPYGAVAGLAIGGPVAIALSPGATLAYVVQTGARGTLIVVDVRERRVTTTIPLGQESFALALSPDGKEAYVADFGSDSVSVVDTSKRQVAANVPVGHGPSGVALSADGRQAYVTNIRSNTVSILDVGARKVVGEIPAGAAPCGLALSRDALFIANSGADSVSVVRTRDHQLAGTIAVGKQPVMVVVSPDATRAYVSNQGDNSVSVIDAVTTRVTTAVPVGAEPFGLALSDDGTLLAVANRSGNTVSILDTRTNNVIRTLQVGTAPFGIVLARGPQSGACHCALGAGGAGGSLAGAVLVLFLAWVWSRRRPHSR